MEEIENDVEVFKVNASLKLLNYLLVVIILIIIAIFSKASIKWACEFALIIVGFYFLFSLASENLRSIKIFKSTHKVNLTFNRFIFINKDLLLTTNEFYFSYKTEIVGRGTKASVLTIYDLNKDKIIKIHPFSSGWSEEKIIAITFLWLDIGVKEYNNQEF